MKLKSALKLASVATILPIALTLVFYVNQHEPVNPEAGQAALAIDPANTKISPELKDAIAKAEPDELIKVWVEFDAEEYENKTGNPVGSLFRQYTSSGMKKIEAGAFNELIPEEIMAVVCRCSTGVAPTVELYKPGLVWHIWELTPNMIGSISNFPGLQKITLYKDAAKFPNVDPILTSYIVKVAEEHPTDKIILAVHLAQQFVMEPPYFSYSYDAISQVLQKFGGEITYIYTALHGIDAIVPANLQLIAELSALNEVERIHPVWTSFVLD